MSVSVKTLTGLSKQQGLTLIEVMIVVVIIGVLAAIALPSYQRYTIKTKRTDMMSEMQNIASQIESRKLVQGNYGGIVTTDLMGNYPRQGNALYTVTVAPTPLNRTWTITATPVLGAQLNNDGALTLNHQGVKCRASICGSSNEWNK
ncbi:type IV pilin protein [Psychrobacter sp. AOP22-C1-C5]|uniref:type IV pilin protein n=1 Tax=Psychrobacter sp. AOP22-C1-C5 TaxID=3457716 RepID=UPI00403683AB